MLSAHHATSWDSVMTLAGGRCLGIKVKTILVWAQGPQQDNPSRVHSFDLTTFLAPLGSSPYILYKVVHLLSLFLQLFPFKHYLN